MRAALLPIAFWATGTLACWSGGDRTRPPSGGPTQPPVGMVTTCSGTEAPLPALADLPNVAALPDPFAGSFRSITT